MADLEMFNPLVSAATGLVSSVLNYGSAINANRNQRLMQARQNEFNRVEAQKQRDWATTQWWSQFNAENAYNDPKNQMSRMAAAGINPFIAAENSSKIGTSASNPSVPSGAVASAAQSLPEHVPQLDLSPILMMGNFLKAINEAKKSGADAETTNQLRDWVVKKAKEDVTTAELQNEYLRKYGDSEHTQNIVYVAAKTLEAYSQRDLNNVTKSKVEEEMRDIMAAAGLKEFDLKLKNATWDDLVEQVHQDLLNKKKEGVLLDESAKTEKAKQGALAAEAQNYVAQASKAFAEAKTENEKRTFIVDNARSLANMSDLEVRKFQQTFWDEVNLTREELAIAKATFAMIMQTKDFNERYELFRGLGSLLGGSVSVNSSLGGRSLKK